MFQQILFPTDFSDSARCSGVAVRALSRHFSGTIHLIHVDEERAMGMHSSDDLIRFMNEVDTRRKQWMEEMAADLSKDGFKVELSRLEGLASEEILKYAEAHAIDLIVLGTVGHTSLKERLLGSTSRAILREADCPVLTLNTRQMLPPDWSPSRILFPTDLSPTSSKGRQLIAPLARSVQSDVTLLSVLKVPIYIPAMPGEAPVSATKQAFEVARGRAEAGLRALSRQPEWEGIEIHTDTLLAGDTADGIARYATENAHGLVVLPRQGRGALRSLFFGRVAEHVVKLTHCPVLTFRV
jgi:nucleotide-binding universal stress UspA family protein